MTWLLQVLESSIPVGFSVLVATLFVRQFLKRSDERYAVLMGGLVLIPLLSAVAPAVGEPSRLATDGLDQVWVVRVWAVGVVLMSVRLVMSLRSIQILLRRSEPLSLPRIQEVVTTVASRLGLQRVPELRISANVVSPAVVGVLKPVVLIPACLLAKLSPGQLEALLAHELAHVKRLDYWANLLQMVLETVFFFHPAVWLLSHLIRQERERCCDDLALSVSGDRRAYASALALAAELRAPLAAAAFTTGCLASRVARVAGVRRAPGLHLPRLLASGVVALVLLTLGTVGATRQEVLRIVGMGQPIVFRLDGERRPTHLMIRRSGSLSELPPGVKARVFFLREPIVRAAPR